jgi:exopolysaccharide biosynthesis WecB/TagA/CpsF family protein
MVGELSLLLDPLCLFGAAALSTLLYTHWFMPAGVGHAMRSDFTQAALVAAVLAPFILYDKRFGAVASRGQMPALMRGHALRFSMLALMVTLLGALGQALEDFPPRWLALWLASSFVLTSLTRAVMGQYVRRLQRQGALAEVVAVVGAGPVADRLVHSLRQTRSESIELLGIFDDRVDRLEPGSTPPGGSIEQLIELGKTRKIDWILLTLPPMAEHRLQTLVQRLKALSVPIGLCPQHVSLALPYHTIDYVGDGVPVGLLADRPIKRWDAVVKAAEDFVPRWVVTLILVPIMALDALASLVGAVRWVVPKPPVAALVCDFDPYDVDGFVEVAADFGQEAYGYAVTPNADHLIRLHEDASFRELYAAASYILLDSRFLSHLLRLTRGIRLPVCTGSDLTARLISDVVASDDTLVLIGCSGAQASRLAARFGLRRLAHFNPPMGFIRDPQSVEECLAFIEAHSPFRFCLLAVGAPQQEAVAQMLKSRGVARGLALCIGASINFLTGDERRAPVWMQRCGVEWLYRLIQAPGRMTQRYLVRGPRVFGLLRHAMIGVRKRGPTPLRLVPASRPAPLDMTAPPGRVEREA